MMANIESILNRLTQDETKELVEQGLGYLVNEDALDVIKKWIRENNMEGEILAEFEDNE